MGTTEPSTASPRSTRRRDQLPSSRAASPTSSEVPAVHSCSPSTKRSRISSRSSCEEHENKCKGRGHKDVPDTNLIILKEGKRYTIGIHKFQHYLNTFRKNHRVVFSHFLWRRRYVLRHSINASNTNTRY